MLKQSIQYVKWFVAIVIVFGGGYFCGRSNGLAPEQIQAQTDESSIRSQLSEQSNEKLRDVFDALNGATASLQGEGRQKSAIQGFNAFSVTVGGIDAVQDLEEGRGVDPETFAGLYAGAASDEVAPHITVNDDGQVLYKDKIVRMYSTGRLKRLFSERLKMSGLGQ